jgi:hypothetical protein
MVYAYGPCALVQIVNILRAKIEAIAHLLLNSCECKVRRIGLGGESVTAAHGIEIPDHCWIGVPGLRSRDLVYPIAVPQASGSAKSRQSALCGNTGTRKNKEPISFCQFHEEDQLAAATACPAGTTAAAAVPLPCRFARAS